MTGVLSAQNRDERNCISDEEALELAHQAHPLICSISRKDKGPIATPLWYEFKDGVFRMGIFPESAKGKLLARRKRATVTLQTVEEPYRFLMVEGPVRFVSNDELASRGDTVWSTMRRVFDRYLDADTAARYEAVLPVLAPDYTIIELSPENVRGESIPVHATIMPEIKDVDRFAELIKQGKTIVEARAELGLYTKEEAATSS